MSQVSQITGGIGLSGDGPGLQEFPDAALGDESEGPDTGEGLSEFEIQLIDGDAGQLVFGIACGGALLCGDVFLNGLIQRGGIGAGGWERGIEQAAVILGRCGDGSASGVNQQFQFFDGHVAAGWAPECFGEGHEAGLQSIGGGGESFGFLEQSGFPCRRPFGIFQEAWCCMSLQGTKYKSRFLQQFRQLGVGFAVQLLCGGPWECGRPCAGTADGDAHGPEDAPAICGGGVQCFDVGVELIAANFQAAVE